MIGPLLAAMLHLHQPELRQVPIREPRVALTVNVVWGTEHLPAMLQALKANGARATFFLGGRWAEAHPEVAKAIRDAGMEIGSHGDAHRHVGSLGIPANEEEISRAEERILRATGVRPKLYAPAYGELSPAVFAAADNRKVRVVMWSIDTIDWRPSHTPGIIQSRVLTRLEPGAIVLMHPTDRTAAALPGLLKELHARGYSSVSVSDLLRIQKREAGPSKMSGEMRGHEQVRTG